jgi:hypothetical protein
VTRIPYRHVTDSFRGGRRRYSQWAGLVSQFITALVSQLVKLRNLESKKCATSPTVTLTEEWPGLLNSQHGKSSSQVLIFRSELVKCIGVLGATLPLCFIFKAKYNNSSWLPAKTLSDWMHATSNSGWTSDTLGLEWLKHCFIPKTRWNNGKRILLLIDSHSSYLASKFIARCIEASIDLINLQPYTLYRL